MAGLPEGVVWDAEIYQIETTDPVKGGLPVIATGSGTSNIPHLQLAQRTQWLRRQLGGFGAVQSVSANLVMGGGDVGKSLFVSAPATITLPPVASAPPGSVVHIFANVAGVTVATAGGDLIVGSGPTNVASVGLNARGTIWLRSDGGGAWLAIGGSAQIGASAAFGASLSGAGYQRLPSGLLVQWGSVIQGAGLSAPVTFPLAFPTACFVVLGTHVGTSCASVIEVFGSRSVTGTTLKLFNDSGAQTSGWTANYVAFGH